MTDAYSSTFAFVQIHHGDSWPTAWGNARWTFYGASGYPTSYFDGVIERVGDQTYEVYRSDYLIRHAVPTDVAVTMTGRQLSGPTFEIVAHICIEPGGTAKTMRIYIVQVLDYWPMPPTYSRNGFKQAAATEDISLVPDGCANVIRTFTFDDVSWSLPANIKMIAWAQEPQAGSPPIDRAGVYQAAQMGWPFSEPEPVPALSQWGAAAMTLCLLIGGTAALRRRRGLPQAHRLADGDEDSALDGDDHGAP